MLFDAELAAFVSKSYSLPPTVQAGDNVRAVCSTFGGEFVVACPGTTDVVGWLRDFSAWPDWFSVLGPCHAGFGGGGKLLWALMRPKLPQDRQITFTGHSLGGALAQVLAAMYGAENRFPCRVVTFGSPRVRLAPNVAFRSLLKQSARCVLYARNGDPIPEVPTRPFYLHAFNVTRIGTAVQSTNPFANHNIALYCADLRALGV